MIPWRIMTNQELALAGNTATVYLSHPQLLLYHSQGNILEVDGIVCTICNFINGPRRNLRVTGLLQREHCTQTAATCPYQLHSLIQSFEIQYRRGPSRLAFESMTSSFEKLRCCLLSRG